MRVKTEKVDNAWFGLCFLFFVFFSPEPCQYFLFTYERGYRISQSLHIEKGHFIPFLEGTAGEKHSRDSAPPHFFPGGRNDLADYCNWEREINTKTALQSSLSLGTACLLRGSLGSADVSVSQLSNTTCDIIALTWNIH